MLRHAAPRNCSQSSSARALLDRFLDGARALGLDETVNPRAFFALHNSFERFGMHFLLEECSPPVSNDAADRGEERARLCAVDRGPSSFAALRAPKFCSLNSITSRGKKKALQPETTDSIAAAKKRP